MSLRSAVTQLALVSGVTLAAVGCGGDESPAAGPRYDSVAEIAERLDGVSGGCDLEYEGLEDGERELSICTLGDGLAELSVWKDPGAVDALVAAGGASGLVRGANWTVSLDDADLAADVAEATGGRVAG